MDFAIQSLIPLIDLTSLNTTDNDAGITRFVQGALTPFGQVAAVCIYPQFVALAREQLNLHDGKNIAVATVVNFPEGGESREAVLKATDKALNDGACEIDLVLPYQALLDGDTATAAKMVHAVRALCPPQQAKLKVIIESGALPDATHIRKASAICIDNGADFIKTSTGKIKVGATVEAVGTILDTIIDYGVQKQVGLKISGGIRQLQDLPPYIRLITEKMGAAWIAPQHFRIGASALLTSIISELSTPSGDHA